MLVNAVAKPLGRSKTDRQVMVVTLSRGETSAVLWSYGARVQAIHLLNGRKKLNIVRSPSDPRMRGSVAGATIGRVANRIKAGHLDVNGHLYHLEQNENENHIHGGSNGLQYQNWTIADLRPEQAMVRFYLKQCQSVDGYPGDVEITCTYKLIDSGLVIDYRAQSSHDTVFAPTVHTYFNLTGERNVLAHSLQIPLDFVQRLNESGLPMGRPIHVKGVSDLNAPTLISKWMTGPRKAKVDCCYNTDGSKVENHLCTLFGKNGMRLQVWSSMPSLQVYCNENLKHDGLKSFAGIALEPQYPPDSVNRIMKNRVLLKAGEARREFVKYEWQVT